MRTRPLRAMGKRLGRLSGVGTRGSAPAASFTLNKTDYTQPEAIIGTDTSTGSPTSWQWAWGIDGVYTDFVTQGTSQNPSLDSNEVTPGSTPSPTIRLTATNVFGSNVSAATTITVSGA